MSDLDVGWKERWGVSEFDVEARSQLKMALQRLVRHKLAMTSVVVLLIIFGAAIFAETLGLPSELTTVDRLLVGVGVQRVGADGGARHLAEDGARLLQHRPTARAQHLGDWSPSLWAQKRTR